MGPLKADQISTDHHSQVYGGNTHKFGHKMFRLLTETVWGPKNMPNHSGDLAAKLKYLKTCNEGTVPVCTNL